jgi:hypothetical protein
VIAKEVTRHVHGLKKLFSGSSRRKIVVRSTRKGTRINPRAGNRSSQMSLATPEFLPLPPLIARLLAKFGFDDWAVQSRLRNLPTELGSPVAICGNQGCPRAGDEAHQRSRRYGWTMQPPDGCGQPPGGGSRKPQVIHKFIRYSAAFTAAADRINARSGPSPALAQLRGSG